MSAEPTPWIIAGVSTIIASLASAVAYLFRLNETNSIKAVTGLEVRVEHYEKRVDHLDKMNRDCLEDRAKLAAKCELFEKRISQIEGKT